MYFRRVQIFQWALAIIAKGCPLSVGKKTFKSHPLLIKAYYITCLQKLKTKTSPLRNTFALQNNYKSKQAFLCICTRLQERISKWSSNTILLKLYQNNGDTY